MQEGYVDVAEIPTHIMTWGKWLDDPFKPDEKEICVCVTGNPGLPGFYSTFLSTIYDSLDKKMPVWVIGLAGHNEPPETSDKVMPALQDNEKMFDLQGQVYHKASFIENYVPKDVKIHLIGHSIGSWLILELFKKPSIKERIHRSYLLFPTFERMAASPNGHFFTTLFPRLNRVAYWLYWFISLLPDTVKIFLISIYFAIFRIPKHFVGTALKYIKPTVVEKVIYLANEEMERVKEADIGIIEANKKMLKFYYGTTDGWVPVQYYYDLKDRVPDVNAELCTRGMAHAFVLRSGPEMGYLVAEWIKENRP